MPINAENRFGMKGFSDSRQSQPKDVSGEYSNLQSEIARGTIPASETESSDDEVPFDLNDRETETDEQAFLDDDETEELAALSNETIIRYLMNIVPDRKIAPYSTNIKNEEV